MTFQYNDRDYTYPASLGEITLSQRIQFYIQYGAPFEEKVKELTDIESEVERAIEETELRLLFAIQSFSFFTGIPVDDIKDRFELSQVMNVYNTSLAMVLTEEMEIEVKESYEFNGEQWVIASPMVTPQSKFTFNEFLTSKEIVRQLEQYSKGKWQSLLYLCCIYFRKQGEEFDEKFIEDGSERMKLIQSLPMDIALAVGFFLSSSMTTFLNILLSSKKDPEKEST